MNDGIKTFSMGILKFVLLMSLMGKWNILKFVLFVSLIMLMGKWNS